MSVKYYRDFQITEPRAIWTGTTTAEIQFVDGDYGSDGNAGWSPKKAVSSITQAITNIGAKSSSIIYVRPRANTTSSNQTYYVDNVTIPVTMPGLAIVGAGSNPSRPYLGVDIKANTSTSALFNVKASHVTLEGMRLAGTGQNATDGVAIVYAYNYGNSSGSPYGLTVRGCRIDNAKTGGGIRMDSPVGVLIENCSFHDCAVGIYSTLSEMAGAAFGPVVQNCDFGGAVAARDMDIYVSQGGLGNTVGHDHFVIKWCNFGDGLPAKGGNNRFIKIANGDTGQIIWCTFPVDPGANMIDTFGASGTQCIIPTSWTMSGCWGSSDADPIHPAAA